MTRNSVIFYHLLLFYHFDQHGCPGRPPAPPFPQETRLGAQRIKESKRPFSWEEDRPEQTQQTGCPAGTGVPECPLVDAAGHDRAPGVDRTKTNLGPRSLDQGL